MKTVKINLFTIDELSKEAQDNVIEEERWNVQASCMECYDTDYQHTLHKFEKATHTFIEEYDVDYNRCEEYHDFRFEDCIEKPFEIRGKYLRRWINNFISSNVKGKYYSKGTKSRRSRIIPESIEGGWCPFTGCVYDVAILDPIVDIYTGKKKVSEEYSLSDLMDDCYHSFFAAWKKETEYWADDRDAILDELHNNQYEDRLYYSDGTLCSDSSRYRYMKESL